MEKININCPHCQKKYKVDARLVGRFVDCKQCNENFQVTDEGAMPLGETLGDSDGPVVTEEMDSSDAPQQAFDPLTPDRPDDRFEHAQLPPEETDDNTPAPEVPTRNWQDELKQRKKDSPFGSSERSLLGFGAVMLLVGILLSLMPRFGSEIAMLGSLTPWVGLGIGFVGVGLLFASLRKFKNASLIGGGVGAAFLLGVFALSMFGGKADGGLANGADGEVEVDNEFTRIASDWFDKSSRWKGFDGESVRPADADNWTKFAVADTGVSANFPGEPEAGQEQMRITRVDSKVRKLTGSDEGIEFMLGVFKHPSAKTKTDNERLIDVETTIAGTGKLKDSKREKVEGFPARWYIIDYENGKRTHGKVVAMDGQMVHLKVTGAAAHVPGPTSLGFLQSVQLTKDSAMKSDVPEFTLSDEQQARQTAIDAKVADLHDWMTKYLHENSTETFSPQYLSEAAGFASGDRRFMVHPRKLPMLGVDVVVARTPRGKLIVDIVPLYEGPTDENSIMAPEGFGIAGMNVNASTYVKGIQLVFMEITPAGFDTMQVRRSEWIGSSTSGKTQRVGVTGRPMYGLWICNKAPLRSIGLVRE